MASYSDNENLMHHMARAAVAEVFKRVFSPNQRMTVAKGTRVEVMNDLGSYATRVRVMYDFRHGQHESLYYEIVIQNHVLEQLSNEPHGNIIPELVRERELEDMFVKILLVEDL